MPKKKFPTSPQVRATLDMLRMRPDHITFNVIAKETGLTHSWISAFSLEQIADPSYSKLEALANYLFKII